MALEETQNPLEQAEEKEEKKNARFEQKKLTIDLIRRLMLKGITNAKEIQDILAKNNPPIHMTLRTIYRHKGTVMKENQLAIKAQDGMKKTVEELAFSLKETFEELQREAWKQYHSPTQIKVTCPSKDCRLEHTIKLNGGSLIKIAALREIKELAEKYIKLMQSLGLVTEAPVKHQMLDKEGNPVDPPEVQNIAALNANFTAFIKAMYQDPTGTKTIAEEKKQQPN